MKASNSWLSPLHLLLAAAILHVALTTLIFTLGRYAVLPGIFDTDGIAFSFASDGVGYRQDAATLAQMLRRGEFRSWLSDSYPVHLKLYAIGFAVLGPLVGSNILAAEPINLLCYLGILVLVSKLAREVVGKRANLIAAGVVALWPSLLLHTTQLLKDSLFMLGMLALILIMMRLLMRVYSWPESLVKGVLGGLLAAGLWSTRSDMAPVLMGVITLGVAMFFVRQLQLKRVVAANLAGMLLLIVCMAVAIWRLPEYRDSDTPRNRAAEAPQQAPSTKGVEGQQVIHWWQPAAQVATVRRRFSTMYSDSSSNIDTDVQFASTAALIRYLPRAAAIGFFAPFPNMWFRPGNSVGLMGRILSGCETLLMYVVEALAIVSLWGRRRQLPAWLLFSIAAMGTIALGLVITNVGTLYRLRYSFLILLIILAAGGTAQVRDWLGKSKSAANPANVALG